MRPSHSPTNPDRHCSDEENLYDLWRRAEEMRRYLETQTERLIVVVAHGGINKVWLAHLMFTAVAGLDTPTQLAAYRGFTRLGWWTTPEFSHSDSARSRVGCGS